MPSDPAATAPVRRLDDVLASAEQLLREAIAVAAHGGLYDLAGAASRVAAEITRLREAASLTQPTVASKSPEAAEQSVASGRSAPSLAPTILLRKTTARGGQRGRGSEYKIKRNVLIRTGRSKTKKGTYEHKIPKVIFMDVLKAMSNLAKESSGPFTVDQIIQTLQQAGCTAPTYQVYGTVSFLKARQAILQEGRNGYLFPPGVEEIGRQGWAEIEGRSVT